jgi:hypothetical protein
VVVDDVELALVVGPAFLRGVAVVVVVVASVVVVVVAVVVGPPVVVGSPVVVVVGSVTTLAARVAVGIGMAGIPAADPHASSRPGTPGGVDRP